MDQGNEHDLAVIKDLVMNGQSHYSKKVRGLIEEGWFQQEDLEQCICSATKIHKVEVDELKTATNGKKYTILGKDTERKPFYTCGKIILSSRESRLYFFVTAHEAK